MRLAENVSARKKTSSGDNLIAPKRKSKTLMDAEKLHSVNEEKHGRDDYVSVGKDGKEDPFVYSQEGLTTSEAEALLKIHGKNELPEKVVPKWYISRSTYCIVLFSN